MFIKKVPTFQNHSMHPKLNPMGKKMRKLKSYLTVSFSLNVVRVTNIKPPLHSQPYKCHLTPYTEEYNKTHFQK